MRIGMRLRRPATKPSGIGVALLVFDQQGNVLSLKRRAGLWDIPNRSVPEFASVRKTASAVLLREAGVRVHSREWRMAYASRQNGLMVVLWVKLKERPAHLVSRNGRSTVFRWSRLHGIYMPMEPYLRDVIPIVSGFKWNMAPLEPR